MEELLRRAALYASAGADGLFAAGVVEPREIAMVCRKSTLPVNLLWRPGLATPEALLQVGVRRLSAGSAIAKILYGSMEGLIRGFLESGQLNTHDLKAKTYGELNALMAGRPQ